jgi:hypothetical protein
MFDGPDVPSTPPAPEPELPEIDAEALARKRASLRNQRTTISSLRIDPIDPGVASSGPPQSGLSIPKS